MTSSGTTRDFIRRTPWRRFAAACEKAGAGLVPVDTNPVDAIWPDRPPAPLGAIMAHKLQFAGESTAAKIARVRQTMGSSRGLLISDPHNLAWLFNIRGSDISYTPLPLGWCYLPLEGHPVGFSTEGSSRRRAARASAAMQTCSSPTPSSRLWRTWAGKASPSHSTPERCRPT